MGKPLISDVSSTANGGARFHPEAAAIGLAVVLLFGGCRAGYLGRLAYEQARYLGAATPVTELLATTEDPKTQQALEALLQVRGFAERQGLEVGGSYRKVAATSSASPFQVVTAAYADRLEPYTWWYPVVGAIPYRGYFDRPSAEGFADELRGRGLDVMIVQASAYSTLGWFDDPLPSSVLDRGELAVVVTVLHELVHQTFFAPGEIAFNETLATAVSWRLTQLYYEQRQQADRAQWASSAREAWMARSDVLDAAALQLHSFFETERERAAVARAAAGNASRTDAARSEVQSRTRMLAARDVLYAGILSEITKVDPRFVSDLHGGGLNNASFLASYRYAKSGRAIDDWLGRQPSMGAALRRLKGALAHKEDLRRVVELGPAVAEGK